MDGQTYHWLGREPISIEVPDVKEKRILITGADGYIGQRLTSYLNELGANVYPTDIDSMNVLNYSAVKRCFNDAKPDIVIHLAAHKYATTAEESPAQVAELNITGTHNVVERAAYWDAKFILASTCKAVDPCTAYGASKLIAERIALNYVDGVVFRLVNVIGSTGSVIDIWNNLPKDIALPVIDAWRYFISPAEAVKYFVACTDLTSGLYAPNIELLKIDRPAYLAMKYGPDRLILHTPLRRGDRYKECITALYEKLDHLPQDTIMKIKGPWE